MGGRGIGGREGEARRGRETKRKGRREGGREGEMEGGKEKGSESSCKCFYLADLEEGVLSYSPGLSEVVVRWECPVDVTEYHLLTRRLLPTS